MNKSNNKRYIGLTKKLVSERFRKHIVAAMNGCKFYFAKAIRKYGIDNFEIYTLETCETLDQAKILEIKWIKTYNSNDHQFGYNLTDGGDGSNRQISEETKYKMRLAKLGKKHSVETRSKMSESNKNMSEETRQKIGRANLGKKYSQDTREKIRIARITTNGMRGKFHSENTKIKLSQFHTGKSCSEETKIKIKNANTGKKHSEESKQKMSEAKKLMWQIRKQSSKNDG